ncbi:MAG: DUF255 domain-containing protein, partial [Gammaproteobacteria bacterium]|nr:DUF255 domain-containing protein [Gammaproteobacteria bacterium]
MLSSYVGILSADTGALKDASSPYVSMHAGDKVKWLEWEESVIEKSRRENKPIFLSIGYFSCYWCHVLQRESFRSEEFANHINANFIPVIVDRELHASLDSYLTRFAEETIGRSGWPLNVVITPDGFPLVATIYLPPVDFVAWVKNISILWDKDPNYMRSVAKDAADEMSMSASAPAADNKLDTSFELQKKLQATFLSELMSVADEFQGGFGDQAKFPLPAILKVALILSGKNNHNNESLKSFLRLTLDNIRFRGLYDHLDGGFFRYTSGPDWQEPHFEKMLYDNAQIASLYLHAGKVLKSELYLETGIELLDYLLTNFRSENGGFYSSFSAIDDKGIEGGYYLWTTTQIAELFQYSTSSTFSLDDMQVVKALWGW